MFPWEILRATSHISCLWEATYCSIICIELPHISATLGAWHRAGCTRTPTALLCSLGQCFSERTLLTHAVIAVLKPASRVEVNTGFGWFNSKQALRDCPMALFQMAAISLTLRERVSGFKEAILHFPYSTIFHADRNALHWCLLPFVAQLCCVVSCSQKLYILPDTQKEWFFPARSSSCH